MYIGTRFDMMSGPDTVLVTPRRPSPHTFLLAKERHMAASHPNVPGVRFKDIPGFTGYCVGDDGSVWSANSPNRHGRRWPRGAAPWREMTYHPHRKMGHLRVQLYGDSGKRVLVHVHRLVLEAFRGLCPAGRECCHDPDPDPANNRLENLRWDTRSANRQDSLRLGWIPFKPRKRASDDDARREGA